MAKVLLFDQFPRAVYRGQAKAFEYDATASALCAIAVYEGWCESDSTVYNPIMRFFIGVCLQHSEDLHFQELGVKIAHSLQERGKKQEELSEIAEYFRSLNGYPHEHYDVIKRFGRFPSRNAAHSRPPTEEEVEWMASPDCPKWAKSQLPLTAEATVTGTTA